MQTSKKTGKIRNRKINRGLSIIITLDFSFLLCLHPFKKFFDCEQTIFVVEGRK